MRRRILEAVLVVGVGVIFAACGIPPTSAPDTRPSYCQKLDDASSELQAAITAAFGGVASDGDRAIIAQASAKLKDAVNDATMPADTKAMVDKATGILDNLAKGQSPTADDLAAFSSLEGMDSQCTRK